MKTIITLEAGLTRLELIPENEFEQTFVNEFDFDTHEHRFGKAYKNQYSPYSGFKQDKKMVIGWIRKEPNDEVSDTTEVK